MKKTLPVCLFFLMSTGVQTWAQPIWKFKFRSNPAYSILNYKHPDRAAMAKKYDLQKPFALHYYEKNSSKVKNRYQNHQINSSACAPSVSKMMILRQRFGKSGNRITPAHYKRQHVSLL
jgi:hypothetical protein